MEERTGMREAMSGVKDGGRGSRDVGGGLSLCVCVCASNNKYAVVSTLKPTMDKRYTSDNMHKLL